MKLSSDQIKQIAKGVLEWEIGSENGLIPRRLTTGQLNVYHANWLHFLRAQAAAGVRLEFATDASELEFTLRVFPGSERMMYGMDLLVDGCLVGHKCGMLVDDEHVHWIHPLPEGEKRVSLYLPCLAGAEILGVNLKDASFCQPVRNKEKILFMGDSITQGYVSWHPYLTYPAQIAAFRDADYLNQGIGGEIFHPEILEALDWNPTMMFVAYGTNDWANTNRQTFTNNAEAFLEKLSCLWPDLPIFVISPIWRGDYLARRGDDFRFEEVEEILMRAVSHHPGMHLISGKGLFPQMPDLMEDGYLHPNALGFGFYAQRLADAMQKWHRA